jgi:hypothetical protein
MKIDDVVTFLVGPFSGVKPCNLVQKRTHIWQNFSLFGFSLHYNRRISVVHVCSNCFKYVLKFFKNLVEKDFFLVDTLTLYFRTILILLYIKTPTRSSVALGLPPSSQLACTSAVVAPVRSHRLPSRVQYLTALASNTAIWQRARPMLRSTFAAATSSAASDSSLPLAKASSSISSCHHQSPSLHAQQHRAPAGQHHSHCTLLVCAAVVVLIFCFPVPP